MNGYESFSKFVKDFKEILANTLPEDRIVFLNRSKNYISTFLDVCNTVLSLNDNKNE